MMDDMDVVVARPPGSLPIPEGGAGGEGRDEIINSGGSTIVNTDINDGGPPLQSKEKGNNSNNNNNSNNKEKVTSPGGEEKSDRKSRKKKDRKKRKSGERRSKTETIKQLEEENAKLKNEVDELNLRLVHLEAREHNKELKLIHLQKELEEARTLLIEKEGDCVEWEQIDREKDKTVVSLNQTIAILQRDLTLLLDEKEKDTEKTKHTKKGKSIAFSHKPLEIFEYPREEDYESEVEGELTSDEYDEEDEGGEGERGANHEGEEGEHAEEGEEEEVADGDDEIIEKQVDETAPPVFLPFPVFSNIRTDNPAPAAPALENPLVKIFSPTVPPPNPDFESPASSPALPHHQPHTPPPESPRNFFTSSNSFITSPHLYKPAGVSNSPPTIHHFFNPQRSNSDSNLSNQNSSPRQNLPNSPSAPSLVPPGTSSSSESELSNVSVKELRTKWESPKGVLSPPLSRV